MNLRNMGCYKPEGRLVAPQGALVAALPSPIWPCPEQEQPWAWKSAGQPHEHSFLHLTTHPTVYALDCIRWTVCELCSDS